MDMRAGEGRDRTRWTGETVQSESQPGARGGPGENGAHMEIYIYIYKYVQLFVCYFIIVIVEQNTEVVFFSSHFFER